MTAEVRLCQRGHIKVKRPYGWHCRKCQYANTVARKEKAIAEGLIPRPRPRWHSESQPTNLKCNRGHPRVRRPRGDLACPTCQNAWNAARKRLERAQGCVHVMQVKWEGLLNTSGDMVCLACVAEQANAA